MKVPPPPTPAAWLLARLVPNRQRAEILGDLEENHRLRAEHFGSRHAWSWYWTQVLTIPIWLWREEVGTVISMTLQEIRYAIRSFRRHPGFTAITIATLALGIGANTAVFSVVDGVLLEPLPFPSPEELVAVRHTAPGLDLPRIGSATGLHTFYSEAATESLWPRSLWAAHAGPYEGRSAAAGFGSHGHSFAVLGPRRFTVARSKLQ